MEEILNPNCSEVVWRLEVPKDTKEAILKSLEPKKDDEEDGIWTSDCEEGCLSDMIKEMDGARDIDEVKFVLIENTTGEDTFGYVQECFGIAKRYKKEEITLHEAKELEHKAFKKSQCEDEG